MTENQSIFYEQQFVDVILPIPLPQLFTYSVPEQFKNQDLEGKRVVVQFGKKKIYTAIVRKTHNVKPELYETKEILDIIDQVPLVTEIQLLFWEWISSYYLCSMGEVMKAALPSGLKLESETRILYNQKIEEENLPLNYFSEIEIVIIDYLSKNQSASITKINSLLDNKKVISTVKALIEKKAAVVEEFLKELYKPKITTLISLTEYYHNDDALKILLDELIRAPKQLKLLMNYITLTDWFKNHLSDEIPKYLEISKKDLLEIKDSSVAALNSLIKKGVFKTIDKEISRLDSFGNKTKEISILNEYQHEAYKNISNQFLSKNVVLLHGITSSGKTEIYIKLINDYLEKGKSILYLLPEIALTSQIINRLINVFGSKVGIYHSKFNDSERIEIWKDTINKKRYSIILGVRSSVFLPFHDLGLIIIDEEHENTYKQFDPSPRYNARDAAIMLAQLQGAKVLLGTATPSIESYFNAKHEKYGLVELFQRFREIELPEIIVINTREEYKRKKMKSHFSSILLENIENSLKQGEQIILFQNRRGFSPYIECKTCGWIPKCANCDVSLTYHKHLNRLLCHYCGYTVPIRNNCPACGDVAIETKGFGTEKIEDEIAIFFPSAKISRLDLDTTRTKKGHMHIINDFEEHRIDILVGTQMVSKGLDFDNVSLVGILNADNMLNFPDFRAFERSYQLMSQVSGRAGRKAKRGRVIIQTSNPEHPIIKNVVENNYSAMYFNQLSERQSFKYPPFYRLIEIILKHKQIHVVDKSAEYMAKLLRKTFKDRVLGPEYPPINRIQNWYQKKILLKIEKEKSAAKAKEYIKEAIFLLKSVADYKNVMVIVDIDPI